MTKEIAAAKVSVSVAKLKRIGSRHKPTYHIKITNFMQGILKPFALFFLLEIPRNF